MNEIVHGQRLAPRKTIPDSCFQISPELHSPQWRDTVPLNIFKTQYSNFFLILLLDLLNHFTINLDDAGAYSVFPSTPKPNHQVLLILPQKYILDRPPPTVLVVILLISYCKAFPK